MKKMLVTSLFMLAMLAWAAAQQPGTNPGRSSGQATAPSSQAPDASQSQPSMPGSAEQNTAPSGGQGPMANAPVTEGCLGGSEPNYTITDKAGTTYRLNIPPNADTSKLVQHVGEPVQVAGNVKDAGNAGNASIDVQRIGAGMGKCPGSGPSGAQSPPKQ
ncbi:MAG TPA: hypothetical protein VKB58_12215 [Terriglobales bacterium]|nr:hypothetical protein [Terriglobales bacterium]